MKLYLISNKFKIKINMYDKTMRYLHLGQFQEKEANNWDTIAIFRLVLLIAHCQHD